MDGALRTILSRFTFLSTWLQNVYVTWEYLLSLGLVANKTPLLILGHNVTQSTDPGEPCWTPSSVYAWPTADQTLKVSSSFASDTLLGGGAQTIRIWWLNAAGVESTTDVNMNGGALVVSAAVTARRVNRVEVVAAGSSGFNNGVITVYATDGVTPLYEMEPGFGFGNSAIQTVPAGKRDVICRFHLQGWSTSISNALFIRYRTAPGLPWKSIGGRSLWEYEVEVVFDVPLRFDAGTDYYVTGGGTSGQVSTVLEGWRESA
jgi:hypothetical protein